MRHRSTAVPLAAAVAALVVYASLYPFSGWRWPPGVDGLGVLRLPWPPWLGQFDAASNFLGYIPLGALVAGAALRAGRGRSAAAGAALGLAALLSLVVELAQQFLPSRVPSLKDCAFNLAGAGLGVMLALAVQATGAVERWHVLRERWFARDSATALVLLLLWPAALLFPTPAPLGLGHVWGEAREALMAAFDGTPWAADAAAWLGPRQANESPLTLLQEGVIVTLGLLAPSLLAYATTHPGWHRTLLAAGAALAGVLVTTVSTALNFGPAHALSWWTAATLPGVGAALLLAALLAGVGRRLAAALGLTVVALLLALVAQAPADPYYAASLQGWEQGRFIRFHGLAQWVGWLWPFAAIAWLLSRLASKGDN
jgi:VanZ family protein